MNIAKIKPCDIADGPGVRVSVFVSGCRRQCKGCHNAEAWDFSYGEPYTEETRKYILKLLEPDYIDGITILGGEPFEPENAAGVAEILYHVRRQYGERKNVWVYTGYSFPSLWERSMMDDDIWQVLHAADILVDGEYREDERDISLEFRGSRNQCILDVKRTLAETRQLRQVSYVLWEGGE